MEDNNTMFSDIQDGEEIAELSHSDKLVGVYTEPNGTFEKIAKFPPKIIDWFLPFFLLLLVIALTNFLLMSNPAISYEMVAKQRAAVEKSMDEAVKSGKMSQEQADQQLDKMGEMMNSPISKVISFFSILVGGFIMFFIVNAFYFLFAKFVFKDAGTYSGVLVASGLTAYISIIGVIIAVILSFAFGRWVMDFSVASLINADRDAAAGYFLSKLDPVTIWAYVVFSIGLARMFKSPTIGKYYALVFGLWIVWSLFAFFVLKSSPFFSNFAR